MSDAKHAFDGRHWHTCPECGKKAYRSRRTARRMAAIYHPGDVMSAYQCPYGDGFHYGHRTGQQRRRGRAA